MPAIIPDSGKIGIMNALLSGLSLNPNCRVRLYSNPITLSKLTVLGDFVEPTYIGYLPVTFPAGTDAGINPADIDVRIFLPVAFSPTAGTGLPVAIYGYFVQWINPATGLPNLLWCEAFGSPWAFLSAGQVLSFVLSLGGSQGT